MSSINVYQMVTNRIVEQLNAGVVPWRQSWVGGPAMAISYTTRKTYSMLNQLLLGRPGEWLTWNQIQNLGGRVKAGAHSRFCVFCQRVEKDVAVNDLDDKLRQRDSYLVLKWYKVFHIDDTTGIESRCQSVVPNHEISPLKLAEDAIASYLQREPSLTFVCDRPSNEAYYSPQKDEVVVPMLNQYKVAEEFYSTAFHELSHSTMTPCRCNRQAEDRSTRFGDAAYSREELVAEIGSAMILGRLGIESECAFRSSVAYIQGWLAALNKDHRMIVWAAAKAEVAAKYILGESESEVNPKTDLQRHETNVEKIGGILVV